MGKFKKRRNNYAERAKNRLRGILGRHTGRYERYGERSLHHFEQVAEFDGKPDQFGYPGI